jgi:serine O-acetyltransferase
MLDDLRSDLRRAAAGPLTPGRVAALALNDAGVQALAVHRLGKWLLASRSSVARRLLPVQRALSALVRLATDIDLDLSADIGPGLVIYHFGGIRVAACRIGADCAIHQEVRIEPRPGERIGPVLGDRVVVNPHACVVGPVRIGDDAKIGAGTKVEQDVPSSALVLGMPPRISRVGSDAVPGAVTARSIP